MTFDPREHMAVIVSACSRHVRVPAIWEAIMVEGARVLAPGERVGTRHAVLVLGYLALLAVGAINLFEGDLTGAALLLLGGFGLFRLRSRLGALVVWLTALFIGLAGLAAGDLRGLLLAAVGAVGAVAAVWPDHELVQAHLQREVPTELAEEEDEEPARQEPLLRIRTVGRISLEGGARDLTATLLERRILAFIWLYLLTQSASGPDGRVQRSALGQEVSPLMDGSTQRVRLRGQIRDLQKLAEPLGDRVKIDGELVGLDLAGCEFDVEELRALVAKCRANPLLSTSLKRRASRLLAEMGSGLYLPGWEEIEHRATGGKGDAGQLVTAVRAQVSDLRADLALALGHALLAAGQPADAIPSLEDALGAAPLREDVARVLVSACLRSGQTSKAEALEAEYSLREKV